MTVGRSFAVRLARVIAVCAMGAVAAPPSAGADLAGLAVEAERLRAEVESLRRVLPVQADEPSGLAGFEVRLGRVEEELRRLTGRIEELEFEQRRLEERFDQLVGDLDRRLGELEEGVARSDAPDAPEEDLPEVAQRPAAAVAPPTRGAEAPPPDDAPGEDALGTIPESALLTTPGPEPESATPPPREDMSAQEQYDAAMNLLRAGDYGGAERGLDLFLELHPDHPLAANAAYWQAESHYVRKDYDAAAAAFARNYRTYGKDAAKAEDNLLKLGMSLEGLGETDKACLSYEELAEEFPDAPTHIKQALDRERQRAECA